MMTDSHELSSPTDTCAGVKNSDDREGDVIVGGGGDGGGLGSSSEAGDSIAIVNRNIFRSKIAYFLCFSAMAFAVPYYSLFLHTRGFTPTVIGFIVAINPTSTMLLVPPLAYLADRKHWGTPILLTAIVVGGLALLLAGFGSEDVSSYGSGSEDLDGRVATESATFTDGGFSAVLSSDVSSSASDSIIRNNVNTPMAMLLAAGGIAVQCVFSAPISPFFDHHIMALLPANRKEEWGALRSYGAYGWGIVAPLAMLVAEYYGFSLCFVAYLAIMFVALGCLLKSVVIRPEPTDMNFLGVLKFVARPEQRRVLLMLAACSVMGIGIAIVSTYLFIFLQSELAAPKILLGVSVTITVVTEIPLFQYSKLVYELFSPRQMVAMAMVGWAMRCVCYSLLTDPWWVLAIEPFHGVTFGLAWLAGVRVVTSSYPPELAASSFGSLHAFMFGFGHIVGMIVGGYGYDALGPHSFFRVCAALMLACMLVFLALDRALVSGKSTSSETNEKEMKGKGVSVITKTEMLHTNDKDDKAGHVVRNDTHPKPAEEVGQAVAIAMTCDMQIAA